MVETGSRDVVSILGGRVEPPLASAIRSALWDYPGRWSVYVDQDLIGGWWLVTLSAEGFHQSVLVRPREQAPAPLRSLVTETITSRGPTLAFGLARGTPAQGTPTLTRASGAQEIQRQST